MGTTEKAANLDFKYSPLSKSSLTKEIASFDSVSVFQCLLYTGIPNAEQGPIFGYAWLMGSADGDAGVPIYAGSVQPHQSAGGWVFAFAFTSPYGSTELGGVVRYTSGNGSNHYVRVFYGTPQ